MGVPIIAMTANSREYFAVIQGNHLIVLNVPMDVAYVFIRTLRHLNLGLADAQLECTCSTISLLYERYCPIKSQQITIHRPAARYPASIFDLSLILLCRNEDPY